MCDFQNPTTKEKMKNDLYNIKNILKNVSEKNPKIYVVIEPLVLELINHLEKVHEWIDGNTVVKEKSDRDIEIKKHLEWFEICNKNYAGSIHSYYETRAASQKAWLYLKGF